MPGKIEQRNICIAAKKLSYSIFEEMLFNNVGWTCSSYHSGSCKIDSPIGVSLQNRLDRVGIVNAAAEGIYICVMINPYY
ncbi:hypothetical protein AXX00_11315 [Pseudomonas aeruginosa]|nr:hypothetical protein AXX00_11315 [Pseudomonas aeruginosa]